MPKTATGKGAGTVKINVSLPAVHTPHRTFLREVRIFVYFLRSSVFFQVERRSWMLKLIFEHHLLGTPERSSKLVHRLKIVLLTG